MFVKLKNMLIALFCAWMLSKLNFDKYILHEFNNLFYINLDLNDYYFAALIIGYANKK
jgi:hypothetical protein